MREGGSVSADGVDGDTGVAEAETLALVIVTAPTQVTAEWEREEGRGIPEYT